MSMTKAEAGRRGGLIGGLATRGKLSVVCPFTGRECFTAPYVQLGEKGAEKTRDIPREIRQAWGRKGQAIAGRGRPRKPQE